MQYLLILSLFIVTIVVSPTQTIAANICLENYARCNDDNWDQRKQAATSCKRLKTADAIASCISPLKGIWKNRDIVCKQERNRCLTDKPLGNLDIDQLKDDIGLTEYEKAKRDLETQRAMRFNYCSNSFKLCIEEYNVISASNRQYLPVCQALRSYCLEPELEPQLYTPMFQPISGKPTLSFVNMLRTNLLEYLRKHEKEKLENGDLPAAVNKAIKNANAGPGVRG